MDNRDMACMGVADYCIYYSSVFTSDIGVGMDIMRICIPWRVNDKDISQTPKKG